jgi:hypothetical protein
MGASLALAGLTGCTRQPTEHIMPYVRQPEELIPGAAVLRDGDHAGRRGQRRPGGKPRRPAHQDGRQSRAPGTLGACDAFSPGVGAATVRSGPRQRHVSTARSAPGRLPGRCAACWRADSQERRRYAHPHRDRDVAHHGGAIRQPSRSSFPRPNGTSGSRPGRTARAPAPCWHSASRSTPITIWRRPNVIVSLDSDFLASGEASLRYARQFAARRRVAAPDTTMNRLYVVEPMPTPTGSKADHRLPLRAGDVEEFAWALATGLGAGARPEEERQRRHLQMDGRPGADLMRKGRQPGDRGRASNRPWSTPWPTP